MVVFLLILSACSSNGGTNSGTSSNTSNDSSQSSKITIWAWDKNFNVKALEIAKEMYLKDNSEANINIIENAQNDIVQKLNTGFGSGTTKGLPNIVLIEDYRAQSFLQAFPDMFYDLTSSFNASDFAPYKLGSTSMDGKNYGLPFDNGVTGLFVRTDYLEQAGYKVQDLQNITWNQYIEIGKKVKAATGKDMLTQDPNDLGLIRTMLQSSSSWYTDKDGKKPNLEGNAVLKEAFEDYRKLMGANIVKPNSDWSQFLAAFNKGDVASVPTGNWINPSIKAEVDQTGKWAIVPTPRLDGQPNSVNASSIGGSSWYVLNIPGKEQAAEFLSKTFGSNVDLYQKLVTDVGAIGTFMPAITGAAYMEEDPFYNNQKTISDFSNWSKEIPNINYGSSTYAIEDILIVEMQNYLNGKSIDDVLKSAQQQAEAQIQ